MKFFRNNYVRRTTILFTGLVFLNMSFFMMEVSVLELDKNNAMIETIAKLISGSGFEEEREGMEEPCEGDTLVKEVDLLVNHDDYHHRALFLIAQRRNGVLDDSLGDTCHLEKFSPPPESTRG